MNDSKVLGQKKSNFIVWSKLSCSIVCSLYRYVIIKATTTDIYMLLQV